MPPTARATMPRQYGFNIVYDKTFPPTTTDFSPIIRAMQATNADLVVFCSYPLSSVGMVLSANELGFKPKMFGGAMVGLQATVFKNKLKSKLNGIVNYETWVPSAKLMAPAADFFKKYQARAPRPRASIRSAIISAAGAMPICRCCGRRQWRQKHRRRQDRRLSAQQPFNTIMVRHQFGKDGEWTKAGRCRCSITTSPMLRTSRLGEA